MTVNYVEHARTFPLDATNAEMQAWRTKRREKYQPPPLGTLGRDCVRYLQTIRHRPDYKGRRTHLLHWVEAFGARTPRASITSPQIEAVMSAWRVAGYAPVTVRHHRTALAQLFTVLDGPGAPNPVLATPRPPDPLPTPRAPALADVEAVFRHLRPSQSRARLRVILTTGLPHKQVMQLEPAHWDRATQTLYVTGRAKGAGAPGRYLPLSTAATQALRDFHRWDCWGPFSTSALHSLVARACTALKIPPWSPYQLRHLHGTLLYQQTGDLATTARLLGHVGTKTAVRYTLAAHKAVDTQAQQKVGAIVGRLVKPKAKADAVRERVRETAQKRSKRAS